MRLQIGDCNIDVTDDQADDLRRQLGTPSGESPEGSKGLIDSAAAAKLLGTSAEYVREHALELGGEKLGSGPKGRWRFDPAKLISSPPAELSIRTDSPKPPQRRRKRQAGGTLLEVRGESPYAP